MPIFASNFSSNSLSGTVVVAGGQANIQLPLAAFAFEGQKTFTVKLRRDSNTGVVLAASNVITIPDTNSNIISFTSNISTINETTNAEVRFTITTANVPNGANIYYTTNSIVNTNLNTADFIGSNTGVITIINNSATFTLSANADYLVEGAESFNILLRTGNANGAVFYTANANTITVLDTSTPRADGNLYVWGYQGQWFDGGSYVPLNILSDGTSTDRSSPVQTTTGGNNWKQVSAGPDTVAAVKADGTLWTWGNNTYGQLGNNTGSGYNRTSVPGQIAGTTWRQASARLSTMAAVKTDGTLWTWGQANKGQLGNNTTVPNKSSPIQVGSATTWDSVSTGYTTIALKTDGTLWGWGGNNYGQLGNGGNANTSNPAQLGSSTWSTAYTTGYNTYGIKTDGTLWGWGYNVGQLGDGTTTSRSSPVQTVAGGSNWQSFAQTLQLNIVGAIKTDGTLWVWGNNAYGQLGDNTITPKSSPIQTVAGGTNWRQVSLGASSIALKTDGSVWAWGFNHKGQLGDGTTTSRSSPVQIVAGSTNWITAINNSTYTMFAIGY